MGYFRSKSGFCGARNGKVLGADAQRLQVMGMADTKPKYLEPTEAERQWNRRVEIEIWQGEPHYRDTVSVTSESK